MVGKAMEFGARNIACAKRTWKLVIFEALQRFRQRHITDQNLAFSFLVFSFGHYMQTMHIL